MPHRMLPARQMLCHPKQRRTQKQRKPQRKTQPPPIVEESHLQFRSYPECG
jgi:hypothetical protein